MKKILIIEDDAQIRYFYREFLKAKGFCAIAAENGRVGVQQAQKQLPDLIICDIMMPELDGYGVLTTLRQDPVTAIIHFIFITGKVTNAELRQGMELGADDYLTKPCTLEELLRAIKARLEKQDALRQWYVAQCQQVQGSQPTTTTTLLDSQSIFPACSQLHKVFQFIEDNYHQQINVDDVAQAVGYSPAYLTNLVKRQTTRTVHSWIVERRMAQARSLLLNTDEPVNQIAMAVGYPDVGHFIRQFRQLYSMPPKAWRNMHRTQLDTQQNCINITLKQKIIH